MANARITIDFRSLDILIPYIRDMQLQNRATSVKISTAHIAFARADCKLSGIVDDKIAYLL